MRPFRRSWCALVTIRRDIEATGWGGVVLGNVWPAYVFALPLGARVSNVVRATSGGSLHDRAQLLQECVTIGFLALVVVLFAVRRRGIRGARATIWTSMVALAGTFLLTLVGYLPVEETTSTATLLAASAVVVVGTLFTIWSLLALGRCFGLFPEVRGLVLRGPYRLVRHPVYLGEFVSAIGLLLVRPQVVVLALVVLFVVLQYWRTVYEERALTTAFPSEYPAYVRQVPRLVPGWR